MFVSLTQQPLSIRNSFALICAAVASVLLLTAGLIGYQQYEHHTRAVDRTLEVEATRMDRTTLLEFEQASYLLESLARQILHMGAGNKEAISRLLRAFDKKQAVISAISWTDASQHAIISSNQGILPTPIDLSDRDYMKKTILDPWKIYSGRPVMGRMTGKQILPLALGVDDYKGNYVGTLLVSIDANYLLQTLQQKAELKNLNVGLITNGLIPVGEAGMEVNFIQNYFTTQTLTHYAQGNKTPPTGPQIEGPPLPPSSPALQTHIQPSASYPLLFLLGVNPKNQLSTLLWETLDRIAPLMLLAVILPLMLLLLRNRILQPLAELQESSNQLLKAEPAEVDTDGPKELRDLSRRFNKIASYISERRRIEHEQRAKTAQMKRAKEQAELSNRVKLDFMSSMSHELRIPLNNIIGFSELMQNEAYGPIGNEQYVSYIQDINHSAELLQSLINDVLALGKAEAEMLELQEKPLEVQFICTKCIRVLGDRLKDAGITIENRVPRDLPKLLVDELRLKQIILNLLINSISHTPSGGSILLEAEITLNKRDEPQFDLIITDYGAKRLPMQQQTSIREQMDEGGRPKLRSRNQIGQLSNLGIPLTKALVAMHQARLEIQSPPGQATRVIVRFPQERLVY